MARPFAAPKLAVATGATNRPVVALHAWGSAGGYYFAQRRRQHGLLRRGRRQLGGSYRGGDDYPFDPDIVDLLELTEPGGGNPTAVALARARGYFADTNLTGNSFVLLVLLKPTLQGVA